MANTLPTTMEYFDNLLGEQLTEGGGSGGGGSSDFSTAEVTIVNNGSVSRTLDIPSCFESTESPLGLPFINYQTQPVASGESATFKVALYKGTAMLNSKLSFETSGNITHNDTYNIYLITGDCTITIS